MRKLIRIILLGLMTVSLVALCGCSGDSVSETTTTDEMETTETVSQKETQTTREMTDKEKLEEATRSAEGETTNTSTPEETTTQTVSDADQPQYLSQILNKDSISFNDLGTSQLVMVVADGNYGTLYCYEKDSSGKWNLVDGISEIPAWVGSNGVTSEPAEGLSSSPKGLWNLGLAFGNNENPGTELEYRDVTENSYWVDDPNSVNYNRWVEGTDDADWSSAEHLCEVSQYAYAVNIEYNYDNPVPGLGSAFFLHCGDGPTAGCVAVDESSMVSILQWLKPGAKILITTAY